MTQDISAIVAQAVAAAIAAQGQDDEPAKATTGRKGRTSAKANVIAFPTHKATVDQTEFRFTVALESRNSKGDVTTTYKAPRVVLLAKGPGADDFRKVCTLPQDAVVALHSLSDKAVNDLAGFEVA